MRGGGSSGPALDSLLHEGTLGHGEGSPVTMYWESPEKAQPHIQPRDDSPGIPLRILSSVISEKLDVLQTLHVWSAEQVARSLGGGGS